MAIENKVFGIVPYDITQSDIVRVQKLMYDDIHDLEQEIGWIASESLSKAMRVFDQKKRLLSEGKAYTVRCVDASFGFEKNKIEFCQAAQCIDSLRSLLNRPQIWTK